MRNQKHIILFFIVAIIAQRPLLFAQLSPDSIHAADIEKTIRFLASDSLRGRGNNDLKLINAATYIGNRFKQAGLLPFPGAHSHYLPFQPSGIKSKTAISKLKWNGEDVPSSHFIHVSPQPDYFSEQGLSHFQVEKLDTAVDPSVFQQWNTGDTPLLLWTDRLQADGKSIFPPSLYIPVEGIRREIVVVYSLSAPKHILLSPNPAYYSKTLYNVVGILPGRTRPEEMVLFSAHYDHLGIRGKRKDTVMNGANDNASGTTAVLALAEYFAKRGDNDRTLVFCAFSGEELGLIGSLAFVHNIVPATITAVVNIEMIGVPQFGENVVFITGHNQSSLHDFLGKGLVAAGLKIVNVPNEYNLFRRSDNFPFALQGVPAHTVMSSDDGDKCYHHVCDEVGRIDMTHLTAVIRAIAKSVRPLIEGKETPSRIDARELDTKSQ